MKTPKTREKLENDREQIRQNRKMVELDCEIPLPVPDRRAADHAGLPAPDRGAGEMRVQVAPPGSARRSCPRRAPMQAERAAFCGRSPLEGREKLSESAPKFKPDFAMFLAPGDASRRRSAGKTGRSGQVSDASYSYRCRFPGKSGERMQPRNPRCLTASVKAIRAVARPRIRSFSAACPARIFFSPRFACRADDFPSSCICRMHLASDRPRPAPA